MTTETPFSLSSNPIHPESNVNLVSQPGPLEISREVPTEGTNSKGPGTNMGQEIQSINEHMFDENLPNKKGVSFNILVVNDALVVQSLMVLSQ